MWVEITQTQIDVVLESAVKQSCALLKELVRAYLDSEQRIITAKVIKRFILHSQKTAFIVEHDFIMATYLADRVIVYTGIPAKEATAHKPQDLLSGMNRFLSDLQITFRRDPVNHRPRINKLFSVKDKEQKAAGTYFYLGDDEEVENKNLSKSEIRRKAKDKKSGNDGKDVKEAEKEELQEISTPAAAAAGTGAAKLKKAKKVEQDNKSS
jgi:ABC-type proline/glycine betaine transport system ATPase subunit